MIAVLEIPKIQRPLVLVKTIKAHMPHPPLEDRTRGGESPMLHLQDSLLVASSFLPFVSPIAGI